MTPQEIAVALDNTHVLEAWIRSVRAHAYKLALAGTKIPGYTVGYGVRHRVWKSDARAAIVMKMMKLGFERNELFHPIEMLSPKQMEDKLRQRKLIPKKKRGQDREPSPLAEFMTLSVPETKLVKLEGASQDQLDEAKNEFK